MTWYLTIRSDAFYTEATDADRLVDFLRNLPGLDQVKPRSFANQSDRPWLLIQLAECDWRGNYQVTEVVQPTINVVELICSQNGDQGWYESLAGQIAQFLGWEARVEHEERWVWTPSMHEA
jgi:hypothetical protein